MHVVKSLDSCHADMSETHGTGRDAGNFATNAAIKRLCACTLNNQLKFMIKFSY